MSNTVCHKKSLYNAQGEHILQEYTGRARQPQGHQPCHQERYGVGKDRLRKVIFLKVYLGDSN